MGEIVGDRYRVEIGSQHIELPIVSIAPDLAIALLMTIDVGVDFLTRAGADLAARVADARPDIVVSAATLGIPVAHEVTRALGLDDYLILQKTPKIHLRDAHSATLSSVTTAEPQRLLLDRARVQAVAHRRVALVDDVIATGGSIVASLELLRRVDADVVVIGSLLLEREAWRDALGADAAMVRSLGRIPMFRPDGRGSWIELP